MPDELLVPMRCQPLLLGKKFHLIDRVTDRLLCDFGAQINNNLQLRNLPKSFFVAKAVLYVESLVSVIDGNFYES